MRLSAVDLFCGAGGLSAGLNAAGIEVVAACDHWPAAVETYRRNLGDHVERFDLADVEASAEALAAHRPDVIAGGPPCQDFSTAGKRVEGDRANLTLSFARIVERCRPPIVLMENVPQARRSHTYARVRSLLREWDYRVAESVLDASRFGVPQLRRRFFMVGWLGDSAPARRFHDWMRDAESVERLTVKQYLGDEIDVDYYYRHPRNYSRRAIFSVEEPSPTIRGVNRPVPPNYRRNHLDSADPEAVRPLTSLERSRIQTFPRDWDWGFERSNRNAELELLIGNAVPVDLAKRVGEGIRQASSA